jgi:cytidylate kinase
MTHPIIITIDGPASSGKGTLARALATHFGFDHLDTGKIYRLVGFNIIQSRQSPADETVAVAAAKKLSTELRAEHLLNPALKDEKYGNAASVVAAMPGVRAALLDAQRHFAARAAKGAVLDGRDCGTVVCPAADVKFFVIASADARANRRLAEMTAMGTPATYDDILFDILARDARDSGRNVAPLMPAPDAHIIDTSDMDADAVLAHALTFIPAPQQT